MHARQYTMRLALGHARGLDLLPRGRAPGQEHDALRAPLADDLEHLGREALPALVLVAVRLVGAHRQHGVEQQDAAVGPGRQQAAPVRRRREGRVVDLQGLVDVDQGRRRGRRRAHGEREAVGLVQVVVGVLAEDDDFDGVEGGVPGPVFRGKRVAELVFLG